MTFAPAAGRSLFLAVLCFNIGGAETNYFPLNVGSEWNYSIETRGLRGTITVRIEETKTIGKNEYFRMTYRCSSNVDSQVREYFVRPADDGIRIIEDPTRPDEETLFVPAGTASGKQWKSREPQSGFCIGGLFRDFRYSSSQAGTVSVTDDSGKTKTHDGCLRIIRTLDPDNQDSLSQYYREIERLYAPDIGLVKEVCRYHTIGLIGFKK